MDKCPETRDRWPIMKTFGPRVFISDQNVRLGKSARPENFEHFVDFRRFFGRDFFVVICGTGGQVFLKGHSFIH